MRLLVTVAVLALSGGLLMGQPIPDDPVVKLRNQRGSSADGDLPPVPRGIVEPPPLPPPEIHVRDMARTRPAARRGKAGRRALAASAKGRTKRTVRAVAAKGKPPRKAAAAPKRRARRG